MYMLIIGIITLIIMIIGTVYEPRKFTNVILLTISLILIFLGIVNLFELNGFLRIVSFGTVFILIPISIIIISLFLIINSYILIKKEGKNFKNLLPAIIGLFLLIAIASVVVIILIPYLKTITYEILLLIVMYALYFSSIFLCFFIYSWLYNLIPKKLKCDYIIIHGCKLLKGKDVTPLLKSRIDKAIEVYIKSCKKAVFVASGGKGSDEKISEAKAIGNYLLSKNIPKDKIILEDKSTSTYENLQYSKLLLDKINKDYYCILVTNNYHAFRTSMYSKKLKMKAQVVGAHTANYYWPSAFIREYIAIIIKYNWLTICIFIIWLIIAICSFL